MNLANWLISAAAQNPTRPALFEGERRIADYGAFAAEAGRVAAWLRGQGVAPGDRMAIFLENRPAYLSLLYGIWMAGAVAVPINAKLHAREAAYIVDHSEARLVFTSGKRAADLAAQCAGAACVDVDRLFGQELTADATLQVEARGPDDLAWLFYTSGTTGQPKGVMITHGMLMSMALCYGTDVDRVRPEDAALYAAPLSHGAGLYNLMHVRAAARHVFPVSGGFDPGEILSLAAHHGSVHMFAAPTMVRRLTDHAKATGRDGTGLRTVVYAGGPMYNADIIDAVAQFGPVFVQIYGQGECPMGITALSRAEVADRDSPGWDLRLASVGRAQSAVEVRIADAVTAGDAGEIMVRGATVMPGYWRAPEATEKTLKDGWLMTGDVGTMDAAGYVTLKDRSKDMIITGGSNVYPREVEEVLLIHPGVAEASVVGRAHPDWGEEVVAFIVGDAEESALDQLCLDRIARFKRPKAYVRLDALPKNNYGKVLKTELRKLL